MKLSTIHSTYNVIYILIIFLGITIADLTRVQILLLFLTIDFNTSRSYFPLFLSCKYGTSIYETDPVIPCRRDEI